jgi:hypothetical protein
MKLRTREYNSFIYHKPVPRNAKIKHNKIEYLVARCYKIHNSEYNYLVKWVNNNKTEWYTENELFHFKAILREYNDTRNLLPQTNSLKQYVYDFKVKQQQQQFTLQELSLYVQRHVRYGNEHPQTYSDKLEFILHKMYEKGELYREYTLYSGYKWEFPKITYKSTSILLLNTELNTTQQNRTNFHNPAPVQKTWKELRENIMNLVINENVITKYQKLMWYNDYPTENLNSLCILADIGSSQQTKCVFKGKKISILQSDKLQC